MKFINQDLEKVMLKISLITVCYNSEKYIEATINSVLNQTYKNIEYIIIDGDSKDRTNELINKYGNKIQIVVSEPDEGLYDAMNKGIKIASGDIIGFLNSDDLFVEKTVLEKIATTFNSSDIDSIYADLFYVDSENPNKIVRYWKTDEFKRGSFKYGWHPPHPTFYARREIYELLGYFDLRYKLAADFELMLRFLEKNLISTKYLSIPLVKMRLGGETNKNLRNIFRQNVECINAFKKNGISFSYFYPIIRIIPKLKQYVNH